MVNLTGIVRGRKPHLIYGVKRAKVPTKLRPHLLPRKEDDGRAPCIPEMFRLLGCWKSNAFEDSFCKEEVQSFMDCVSRQLEMGRQKRTSDWTQAEVNATLKHFTTYLQRPRSK
ncbi:small ribosomal subunit protein mS37-like [Montipora capricornis]|uniref:small ribosomal subunit protein mS37-like n=1 Tax=Montipora foliosa TaxID=591990 RepID=UPI0035F1464C